MNGRSPWVHGVGIFPGKDHLGEDEGDVEGRADKKSEAGVLCADLNASKYDTSDRVGGETGDVVTDESLPSSSKGDSNHGELAPAS